jgi:mono/diheme cytochrome c family protein
MKRSTWIILAIVFITTATAVISCKTRFQGTAATDAVTKSPGSIERGRVLAYSICAGCHYNRQVNKFIGNRIEDVPGIVGQVYSANLTHSKTNGIPSKYTDAQIKYLLKTGISYNGRFIPYMLRPNMSEADLDAIVSFLRSDDPALAAADTTVGLTHYNLIGKTYMGMSAKPLTYLTGIKTPGENEQVALGGYLVDNLGCFHCHSKSLTSLNYLYPAQSKGFMAGGAALKGANGATVTASNITPDKQTGIGAFTREQFLKALKDSQSPQRKLVAPMPKFKMLSDGEIDAIYAYIQTIPAIDHKVKLY